MDTKTKKKRRKISEEKTTLVGVVRYRLYPTKEQIDLIEKISNTLRHLYNNLLEQHFYAIRTNDKIRSLYKKEKNASNFTTKFYEIIRQDVELKSKYMQGLYDKDIHESEKTHQKRLVIDQDLGKKTIDKLLAVYTGENRQYLEELSKTHERWRDEIKTTVKNTVKKFLGTKKNIPKGSKIPPWLFGKPHFKKYGEFVSISQQYNNPVIKERMAKALQLGEKKKNRKHVDIPGIGSIYAVIHRALPGSPLRHRVVKEGNEYYLAVTFEVRNGVKQIHKTLEKNENTVVGIDVGVKNTVADSTGRLFPANEKVKELENRYVQLQSMKDKKLDHLAELLGKEKKYIKEEEKTGRIKDIENRMRKIAQHARRIKEYQQHKLSKEYADTFPYIVVEDLQIKNMTASAKGTEENPGKNVSAKSGLNKSILRESWGKFFNMLQYKANNNGGEFHKVNPKNTSRKCPKCGFTSAENRQTQSAFKCTQCGYEKHADTVGAINVRERFLSVNCIECSNEENQIDSVETADNNA